LADWRAWRAGWMFVLLLQNNPTASRPNNRFFPVRTVLVGGFRAKKYWKFAIFSLQNQKELW
jgi:hypothetical protein